MNPVGPQPHVLMGQGWSRQYVGDRRWSQWIAESRHAFEYRDLMFTSTVNGHPGVCTSSWETLVAGVFWWPSPYSIGPLR